MSASRTQLELIEKLLDRGADIPCTENGDPDWAMMNSVKDADLFIKKWGHLMKQSTTSLNAGEWGGVLNN